MKENIFKYTLVELESKIIADGFKKFNASQIYEWIYKKFETNFSNMSNLSKDFRNYLEENFSTNLLVDLVTEESSDGTIKVLFMLDDKKTIETVMMPQKYGQSVCVTTQVGCRMSCTFCASGLIKTERNLTTDEIVRQVYVMNQVLRKKYKDDLTNPRARVSHIVVMGIGEPMDNFDNVMNFLNIIKHPKGLEIGARHITVSTCGVVPKIKLFAELQPQVNLAISLHASTNEVRNKLMPINKAFPLEVLIPAVKEYIAYTNRRVTFEYILIDGLNDSEEQAISLSKIIKGMNCYVNLIPYNEVEENPYKKSRNVGNFFKKLSSLKINCTVRKEFGSDINAACGQLRAKREGIIKNEI